MGFISTGDTTQLTAYLTQKGRELFLNGTQEQKTATYFSLGDSDTNYHILFNLEQGYVPDITGDNTDCILSLADNVGIKYNVLFNSTKVPVDPKVQVMFKRPDNNQFYNTIDCLIHLDKISRYQLYNSAGNLSNSNRLKSLNNLLSPLQDLYKQVSIVSNPSLNPLPTDFSPNDNMVFEMLFNADIFKKLNNTFIQDNATNTINQTGSTKSPITFTFSSLSGSGSTAYKGAGKASIGLYGREIGYLFKPIDSINTWEFYNPSKFEGIKNYTFYTDNNNALLNHYTNYTIAAKIIAKDDSSGLYKTFIYRGDKNLTNISDSILSSFNNELKFSNQYAKLFADSYPVIDLVRGDTDFNTPVISGLMQKEVSNLKDFVETSNLFTKIQGTNEYRTSKLSFNVYPENNNSNVIPGVLNIVLKFDEDEVLNGDIDYSHISDTGDITFIEYDFTSTNGIFKNKTKTGTFIKNNCSTNFSGSQVIYTVSGGTYTGLTQAAADTLATNDIASNGQTYANNHGTCTPTITYNSSLYSQYVQKNNCASGYMGSMVLVQYPAGQFTSTISVSDANYKASQAAQIKANTDGTCTFIN